MKRRLAAVALCIAAIAAVLASSSPAAAGGAGAASGTHLPHFDILSTPIKLSEAPRVLRAAFWELGKKQRGGLRIGRVHLDGSTITAVGNRHLVCYIQWRPRLGGGGSCARYPEALRRGVSSVSPCAGSHRDMSRIGGIVPNGVTELGVDRHADGTIEETVPVVSNAFSLELEQKGVVLHGIGDARATQIELKYPLRRLGGTCNRQRR